GARLVIGNQAIAFRNAHGSQYDYFDLGEEWTQRTGLPFVYAMWLIRPEIPETKKVANELRELKTLGMDRIDEIVSAEQNVSADFCRRYLGGYIRYDLGDEEKCGIEKWRELLLKHGLLAAPAMPLQFL